MLEGAVLGVIRAALGLVALVAIAVQMAWVLTLADSSILNYSSYFVILVGFVAAVVLITHANVNLRGGADPSLSYLRGAATLYMIAVLIGTLSSGGQLQPGVFTWATVMLHWVLPIALIVDWFAAPPVQVLDWRRCLQWLVFPLAWVVYTLLHGAFTGWYPYQRINPSVNGWGVLVYLVVSAIVLVVIIFLLTRLPWLYAARPKAVKAKPARARAAAGTPPPPVPPPFYPATPAKTQKSNRKKSKK